MKKAILFIVLAALCSFVKVTAQNTNSQSTQNITGKVTDEKGQPLPGATITLKEKPGIVTTTDQNGIFKMNPVPTTGTLVISFISYQTSEIKYNVVTLNPLNIQLKTDVNLLNEVQVIGYGTITKRLNTGNVSTVLSKQIENQPISNPLAALQGQMAGVLVQTQNGLPGGNIKIQIRGQGSLASGTDPLYIIDGTPFLSAPVYGPAAASGANGAISPFSIINPNDIESIDVLKDADATSIYGSRGANGVVLITTKKGSAGKDKISVDFNSGFSTVSRLNEYLNLQQYLQLRREAFKNDNITPTVNNAPDLLVWDTTKSTYWNKYFYGRAAKINNLQASLSGGDNNNRYIFSLNYRDEGTIFQGNQNYKKGGGYFDLEHTSDNKRFSSSVSINYNKDDNHTLYNAGNNAALPPNFPIYNSDGSFNWVLGSNSEANLQQKQHSKTNYFNVNTSFKHVIIPGFDAKITAGYSNYLLDQVATVPVTSQNPANSPVALAYFANNSSERYIVEPQLNYSKQIYHGQLTALLGGTYQNVLNQGYTLTGSDVNNPDLLGNIGAAGTITAKANTFSQYRYASIFGRVNYNFKQKYLLDINLRRDGSSRFGPGKQYGNFVAVGAGWIFSEEKIIKDNLSFLSFGKLRGSYGLTGNDQISDYQYLSTYSSSSTYGTVSTLTPSRIANPDYGWETTKKLELALDLGILKDRIILSSSWYRNTSSNQLISYAIPYVTGFASYQANFPAVISNTGIEFELNAKPIVGKSFNWNTSFNLTLSRNKLVEFPGIESSSYQYTYVVGQDLSVYKVYQFTGVDPQTGLAKFKDINNDGSVSFPSDIIVGGKTSPDFFGGFANSVSYKGIQFDVLFEFVKRKNLAYNPSLGSSVTNDPLFVLNRWKKPGDVTDIPRATADVSNLDLYSTLNYSDASYIRFKNLALSYNLGESILKRLKFTGIKFYVLGQNLFQISNKNRADAEISGTSTAISPLKTWTFGIKFTL